MEDNNKVKGWIGGSLPLIYLVVGLLALRWTLVEPYVVPTGSMEPTLKTGDKLWAVKCAYDVRLPFTDIILFRVKPVERGDIILFRAPRNPSITYVKRALAIAGDTIEMRDGRVILNGAEVERHAMADRSIMYDIDRKDDKVLSVENLTGVKHYMILDNGAPQNRDFGPIVVPPGNVLAIGDNRDNSHDSRAWGFVPVEELKGKAIAIWLSSWDTINGPEAARRYTTSLPAQVWYMFYDLLFFLVHFPSGESYLRPERIGTLVQ